MNNGKSLIRVGALLAMVGFVLPTLTVSCGIAPAAGRPLSLLDLAGTQGILYLMPLSLIAVLILSFLPAESDSQVVQFFWGQVVAVAIGAFIIIVALLSLSSQLGQFQGMLQIRPAFGLLFLVGGYVLMAVGLVLDWQELGGVSHMPNRPRSPVYRAPPPISPGPAPPAGPSPDSAQPYARLELVQGHFPQRIVVIRTDNFSIGRGVQNDLHLPDPTVSRQHARIRYAQGAWFIQDQNSMAGVIVNGRRVPAARLNSGDQVKIGETLFIFRTS